MNPALSLLIASLMMNTAVAAQSTPPNAEKRPHTVTAPFGAQPLAARGVVAWRRELDVAAMQAASDGLRITAIL